MTRVAGPRGGVRQVGADRSQLTHGIAIAIHVHHLQQARVGYGDA